MNEFRKFLRQGPKPKHLIPLAAWFLLLLFLAMLQLEWVWLVIVGCYVYYLLLRWSIRADRREKWAREWSKVMNDLGEYSELHDEGK